MIEPNAIRRTILEMLFRAKASHLGSSMSVVESLIAMYGAVNIDEIRAQHPDRSRIIVSKGHCAAAVYATMYHYGLLSSEQILSYHINRSFLQGHVSHGVARVEHSTGALGHGYSVAVGAALGLRARGAHTARVLCLVGDGEIQEGSIWEALMLAQHHKLSNLVLIVDNNKISSITSTDSVIDLKPVRQRFGGFGVQTFEVDGHDLPQLCAALEESFCGPTTSVIIANTIKGKGIPFAENQPIWHYRSLSEADFRTAYSAVGGTL